jgi:hypothetical protein
MKKFLVVLLIIVIGGLVFFFGWVQLKVPPGSYGILRSKTHGIDERLIREGEFRWVWYKLIPTNAVITVFTPVTVDRLLRSVGSLPSGDTYSAFTGFPANFSYEIEGSLSFSIKADSLPVLMQERGIRNQQDLIALENKLGDEITALASRWLESCGKEEEKLRGLTEDGSTGDLQREILAAFPDIENLYCAIHMVRSPDYDLYNSARTLYEDYISRQHELLEQAVRISADTHVNALLRYDELTKFGELFTKYPLLLYYLAIERGTDQQIWDILKTRIDPKGEYPQ